ncbi:ribosomal peptide maturation radical SAM protein 1 [Actinopolyspora xinjiangensis]|uniref:Ribosomal peptide maturation radical SAM protein 1 n=1 Tax=Actinopolyspora xinjiangensis TaxID=405564 RepID=A0A1H0WYX8_9ACTN|nr:RiPP maturation radical SAM C-methyltransferase [Actinopolyspora xinjiangensis]SDP95789.1 ribosomal peptide maturation radical SAM protein 1 [Actinopolyspora xinjiangensis]
MRITLASMPWQALESPSLPIALLRSACRREGLEVPSGYHGGIHWCEYLMERTDGELGVPQYTDIAENGLFDEIGDWIFAGNLYGADFGVEAFREYARGRTIDLELAFEMRELTAGYLEEAYSAVMNTAPDIVGFTTTFMQNVPSLALARMIKERHPDVTIVFGGGNCDGAMGPALHRNFEFIDLVVSGEAEIAFPELIRRLHAGSDLTPVAGLSWRDGAELRANPPARGPVQPDQLVVPDYDDWFELLETSPVAEHIEPQLIIETSRGCWWGEKHQCTFCGLNGSLMKFRAKTPEQAIDEISTLVEKHQVLDVITVDNIIDNGYFSTVLPEIEKLGWDVRIHYETKSNLTREHIARFKGAGVAHVQPGIESLVSPVLKLMDKGVAGIRNVRTLRDCESASLTVSWNWLYGFPGERLSDYLPVLEQLDRLHHLQPPANAARILIERFSPYFNDSALGFNELRPAQQYKYVYNLPEKSLEDMVYLFDAEQRGLSEQEISGLKEAIERWIEHYQDSSLEVSGDDELLWISDRRVGREPADHEIRGRELVALYGELEHGRTTGGLRKIRDREGFGITDGELDAWLSELDARGLVFVEHGHYLALATHSVPVKLETRRA